MYRLTGYVLLAIVMAVTIVSIPSTRAAPQGPSEIAASGPARSLSTLGLRGWSVQSSAIAAQGGRQISTPRFDTSTWLPVKPDDAGAPGTEIGALLQNGACPDVFVSTHLRDCFGFTNTVGPVTTAPFDVPWWFRTDFIPSLRSDEHAKLIINGIIGQADVWVNGTRVATQATVQGAFARYTFDITSLILPGTNSLALKIQPNDPTAMYTLDNVDWTQIALDNNTGIQFPIQLQISPALGISNAHVMQTNAPDMSRSALTVKADVTNNTAATQTGVVSATITPPEGGGDPIALRQSVSIPARTTRTVSFTPSAHHQLTIDHPQIWWPYQMGASPLYELSMSVSQGDRSSESGPATFGIRTITTRLTRPSDMAPDGVRVFAINGKSFLFRGGGFTEELFLRYSSSDLSNQIRLIRDLGLNGIRTEGKEMPDDFYQQMDRAGIMIDAGFQCCDKWQFEPDDPPLPAHELDVIRRSSLTIGQRLRNHPSVIKYGWSDNTPLPDQERVSLQGFAEADFQEPIIASAEYKSTPTLGQAGEKEGPYDWVPPTYWYDTTHEDPGDPTFTNVGGSWGFDSEQSAGHLVPTMDSLKRFLSPAEREQLWRNPDFNQYHTNYEPAVPPCPDGSGYCFGTLHNMDVALQKRYGGWSSLEQYVLMAQVQNYEDTRAQFEAFIDHWTNTPTPATGTIYWQLNKGWPTLLWALYNHDYDQAGAYFGAKKANQRLHVLFAYDNNTVTVDNLSGASQAGLSVESKVYSLDGRLLDDQVANNITLPSQGVANAVIRSRVPATTVPPAAARTFFVKLLLKQHDRVVDRNVYWLSTQKDVVDWNATMGKPQATMRQFGDLRALRNLPTAQVTATARTNQDDGRGVTEVTISNTSHTPTVGFFLRADVRRGNVNGTERPGDNQILPITWSDNDVTLWPGESMTLTATYDPAALNGATPVVSLFGWNVPRFVVAAK